MSEYTYTPRAKGTSARQQAEWRERYAAAPDLDETQEHILAVVEAIEAADEWSNDVYNKLVRRLARAGHPILPKAQIRRGYRALVEQGVAEENPFVLRRLRMKPTRTLSGVAPVTVLTKPFPCPGKCIFCPDDVRMPKSYLSNEPGAMRALMLEFDPYVQVRERIEAMRRVGHTVDKVELLVLGGTWSAYPRSYQVWFVRRCFDAMNHRPHPPAPSPYHREGEEKSHPRAVGEANCQAETAEPFLHAPIPYHGEGEDNGEYAEQHAEAEEWALLEAAQQANEHAPHRNVGLVIETRPDRVSEAEVRRLRRLGVTRVQLGVQSLDDRVLALNKRGHTVEDVRRAVRLLRGAGFKIALHWMPNLLGATPATDLADFEQFWSDPALRPDEMKLYPTGLLRDTELYEHYRRGAYQPYAEPELEDLLVACKRLVPAYCRLNRVMRDIPAPDIADGVTTSNLRQIVQQRLREAGTPCRCIRCREVRRETVEPGALRFETLAYDTDHSRELFLSAVTPGDRLAGFLRLSLPTAPAPIEEIDGQAIIRQVQVYGPSVALDADSDGRAQHQGIGSTLIAHAFEAARAAGFERIAVIAAVGTRAYYRRFGFKRGELYMSAPLGREAGA